MSLLHRERHEILAGIGVGYGKLTMGVAYRTNHVISNIYIKIYNGIARFLCDSTAFLFYAYKYVSGDESRWAPWSYGNACTRPMRLFCCMCDVLCPRY